MRASVTPPRGAVAPTAVVAAAAVLALAAGSTRAAEYTYTQVDLLPATTAGGYSFPAINDAGTVAYTRPVAPTPGTTTNRGLFLSTSPTPLVTTDSSTAITGSSTAKYSLTIGAQPHLNNNGVVAIQSTVSGSGSVLLTGKATGGVTPRYQTSASGFSSFGDPAINDNDVLAFTGVYNPAAGRPDGVFRGSGGPLTTIGTTTFLLHHRVGINTAGTVSCTLFDGTNWVVYAGDGTGTPTALADTGGAFSNLYDPQITDRNRVAFGADYDGSPSGSRLHARTIGSPTTDTLVGIDGPYASALAFSINDDGNYVFGAVTDAAPTGSGVYTGPDPLADKVLATGDTLFGKTVTQARLSRDAINIHEQVVMTVSFADDTRALIVATPVPEPSAAALAVTAGALLLRRRRRAAH